MPVPTLRQPTDRLPHGPAGQLGPTLPQPDGLLPAAMPRRGRFPPPLLLGAQALPSLLGLCVCAAPGHGLATLATCLRLIPGWESGPGVQSPCQRGQGTGMFKPSKALHEAAGSRDKTEDLERNSDFCTFWKHFWEGAGSACAARGCCYGISAQERTPKTC